MHIAFATEFTDNMILLNEEESRHCIQVLRMQVNEELMVVDGKGGSYKCAIATAHPKRCELTIVSTQQEYGKTDFELTIACAPTKNSERFEWFLEKATEIGVHKILPISCAHSERTVLKTERLKKVLVAAMKQSVKAYLPELHELEKFKSVIDAYKNFAGQKFIAHCHEGDKKSLQALYKKGMDVLLLIGPEGDFNQEEVKFATENNFIPVSLSKSRLRTETAALHACSTINLANDN